MATPWKTVRVFISSTFRDMHAERNHLINEVFLELRDWCAKRRLHLVDVDLRWGVTEEEERRGKVLEICLDEIQRCRPFFIGLLGERYGWTPSEYTVSNEPEYDWVRDFEKGYSLTALEIYHGVLRDPAMKARSFFYFRDPKFINDIPEEYRPDFLPESNDAAKKLLKLKDEIRARCPVYDNYPCAYGGLDESGKVAVTGLEEFGRRVLSNLQAAISAEHPFDALQPDEIEVERSYHETFIENSTKRFIGRRTLLNQLNEYADGENNKSLVVTGKAGCGKSALLAKFAKEFAEKHADTFVLSHFIGVSPGSTDIRRTMLRLSRELKRKFSIPEDVPTDYYELRQAFPQFLESAAASGKVLLILDALNQLDESHFSHTVEWLPHTLSQGLKVIVSTLEGDCLDSLHKRTPALEEIIIGALTDVERKEIVRQTLDDYRKKLDERPEKDQMGLLLSKTESDNPLYLIVACEEMRVFGVFERVTEKIKALAENIEGLFGQVLERLETTHDKTLVKDALSLLECSRHGLLEGEMLELLARDGEKQLPQAIWSRLYWSLKPYLRPPGEGGEGALDFFHRQPSKAVREKYLRGDGDEIPYHKRLARLFKDNTDPNDDKSWTGNYPRGLSELAHHLLAGKLHDGLFQVARDETFLQAQANASIEEPAVQLDTLQKALTGAAQIDDAAMMAEFMLCHARRVMKVSEVSPLDALRAGRLEQALNLAGLIFSRDKERGALWFLLLAWHLKRQDRSEDARRILADLAAKDLPRLTDDDWQKLATLALCQLTEVDEYSFLVVQEKLLSDEKQLTLYQNLLANYKKQEVNSRNERIINLAFQIAEKKNDEDDRASALSEIAKAQAAAEVFEEAFKTVRGINIQYIRAGAWAVLAKAQAAAGRVEEADKTFKEAIKTAREIVYEGNRASVLRQIAKAQAAAGKVAEAAKTFEITKLQAAAGKDEKAVTVGFEEAMKYEQTLEVYNQRDRVETLIAIAKAQAVAGKTEQADKTFEDALKTVDETHGIIFGIRDEFDRARTLAVIAKAQAAGGRVEEADKTFEEALKTVGKMGEMGDEFEQRQFTLSEIAKAQAAAGKLEAALKTAGEISNPWDCVFALCEIAIAQAAAGKVEVADKTFEEALRTARKAGSFYDCSVALAGIARTQATAGKDDEAIKVFEEALRMARKCGVPSSVSLHLNLPFSTTRDYKWRAKALFQIAVEQAAAGKVEEAIKTFEETLKAVDERSETGGESFRANALAVIAKTQAATGKVEEALNTAREISNKNCQAIALSEIAEAQAAAGRDEEAIKTFEEAIKTAKGSYNWGWAQASDQAEALRQIVAAQAAAGKDDEALKMVGLISDPWDRASALSEMAEAQAAAGRVKEALRTARGISNKNWRVEALGKIAEAQVAARKSEVTATLSLLQKLLIKILQSVKMIFARIPFEEALKTAREISDEDDRASALREIAKAQAATGRVREADKTFEEAVRTVDRVSGMNEENRRAFLLVQIAKAQAAAGRVEEALKTARKLRSESDRASVLSEIVKAQATVGKVEEALKTAREINETLCKDIRVKALSEIAKAQAAAGKVEEADKTIEEALKTAKELGKWGSDQAEALTEIAKTQSASGKNEEAAKTFEEAINTVREMRETMDGFDRRRALVGIAEAQAKVRQDEEAIKTIQLILVRTEDAISQVAEVFVSNEAKDSFKQLLSSASNHISAAYKMCGLLAQLYSDDEDAIDKIAALVMS